MKTLIIGGTSFFGKDIVERALDAGHQVTLCSRGNNRPHFWERVTHISADRTDHNAFSKALAKQQFDVVIDNIAYTGKDVKNALEAFRGNIGRYILTSSNAVYMGSGPFDQPMSETDVKFEASVKSQPTNPSNAFLEWLINYAKGKIEGERAVLEQGEVPYTILRPPYVCGPEDRAHLCHFYFQRLLDGKPLILTNGGRQCFQPVFRHDLANAYLLVLSNPITINQVYNIAQTKGCRLVDWVKLSAKCLRVPPNIISIPADSMQKAKFQYPEPFTSSDPIPLDTSKARAELGFKPTPMESWTAITARWYLETIHEQDSPGYTDREREIEFAGRHSEQVSSI